MVLQRGNSVSARLRLERLKSSDVFNTVVFAARLRAAADDATLKGFSPACSLAVPRVATVLAGFVALISCFPPAIVAAAPLSNSKVGKFAWLKCCESVCHELSYVTGVIWVTDLQVWKTGIPERERPGFFNTFTIISAQGLWTSGFESSSPVLLH